MNKIHHFRGINLSLCIFRLKKVRNKGKVYRMKKKEKIKWQKKIHTTKI